MANKPTLTLNPTLVAGLLLALVAAGCGSPKEAEPGPAPAVAVDQPTATIRPAAIDAPPASVPIGAATGPVARLQTNTGVLSLDLNAGRLLGSQKGMASADWSSVVAHEGAEVMFTHALSGVESYRSKVPAGLSLSAIDANGEIAVLSDFGGLNERGVPAGKSTTRIAIVDSRTKREPKELVVTGNLQPEAVTADRRFVIALDYVPATAPERYEVRAIDITSGSTKKVGARPKELAAEQMQGIPRTSLYSADRSMLFTLYGQYGGGHDAHAFIHAVALGGGDAPWSFCIDLPHSGDFGNGAAALSLSPDGKRLYATSSSGQVAVIDTEPFSLRVLRTGPSLASATSAAAVASTPNALAVAVGADVFVLNPQTLQQISRFRAGGPVVGLAATGDGKLAVATSGGLDVVDLPSGTKSASVATKLPVPTRFAVR